MPKMNPIDELLETLDSNGGIAPKGFDLTNSLQEIVNNGRVNSAGSIQVIKTTAGVASQDRTDNGSMLATFEAAFPDTQFEEFVNSEGQKGIRSIGKKPSTFGSETPIPEGYSVDTGMRGIQDLQKALESATDDQEKAKIAITLNAAVQTQKAVQFGRFKRQAESEFGVPELMASIEQVKQAEMQSPYNPHTGMPSAQRMELIGSLGVARTRAAARVGELMQTDPKLAAAENLAKATLTQIDTSLKLVGRQEIIDERQRKKAAREAAIASFDPNFVNNVAILKLGKPADDKVSQSIREQIVDGKLKLSDTERLLATADDATLQNYYAQTKTPKDKGLALQMLAAKELQATGDVTTAGNNMKIFQAVMDSNLADQSNPYVTPTMRKRYQTANLEITSQSAASGKSKDELLAARSFALKREILGDVARQYILSDVANWQGLVSSDDTAKQILMQAKKDGKPLNFKSFVTNYLNTNDGKDLSAKSRALQAIIASATDSLPKSSIIPIPSAESMMQQAQMLMMVAAKDYYYSNPLMPGGYGDSLHPGGTFQNYWDKSVLKKGKGQ